MVYVTGKISPKHRQMSLEELLFSDAPVITDGDTTTTRTYKVENLSSKIVAATKVNQKIDYLKAFNRSTAQLRNQNRDTLYQTFYTPKRDKGMPYVFKQIFAKQKRYIDCDTKAVFDIIRDEFFKLRSQHKTAEDTAIRTAAFERGTEALTSAGFDMTVDVLEDIFKSAFRRIDAPCTELNSALYTLKGIFEEQFGALYHTSAFAYIKQRSTIDAVKRHQQNESKWFGKYDLSNFFGSTTVEFIMKMFSMIYPFSEVCKNPEGYEELREALSLCVLHGVLPQGTPISPLITNVMMIPIDYTLANKLKDYKKTRYVYTRYADDFIISSKYSFNVREIEGVIIDTLKEFGAPFKVNESKTKYGSSAGSNWNLGVMLNKDNQITVGYKKKRQFKAMLSSYIMDNKNGSRWDRADVQTLEGYRNYYRMVEPEVIDGMIDHINRKFNVDSVAMIKEDLKR